jgi:hypothetical protein
MCQKAIPPLTPNSPHPNKKDQIKKKPSVNDRELPTFGASCSSLRAAFPSSLINLTCVLTLSSCESIHCLTSQFSASRANSLASEGKDLQYWPTTILCLKLILIVIKNTFDSIWRSYNWRQYHSELSASEVNIYNSAHPDISINAIAENPCLGKEL